MISELREVGAAKGHLLGFFFGGVSEHQGVERRMKCREIECQTARKRPKVHCKITRPCKDVTRFGKMSRRGSWTGRFHEKGGNSGQCSSWKGEKVAALRLL